MFEFLNKFKIPTILGLGVIILGIGAGVVLVVIGNQTLTTQASPDQAPKDNIINFSNITSSSVTISWVTDATVTSFVKYGLSSTEEHTAIDERDKQKPTARNTHYFTLKNLTPQTTYQAKIFSGKLVYPKVLTFTTPTNTDNQNSYKPIIGTALQNYQPVTEGIVYLSVSGAYLQSALIKNLGSFIIPINNMQKAELNGTFIPGDNTNAKLTTITSQGKGTVVFKLGNSDKPIGTIKIGEDLDLTTLPNPSVSPITNPYLFIYDLNNDGFINATDYSIVLKNFGRNPIEKKADIDKDGKVDKKDLDLISQQIIPSASPRTNR